MHPAIWLALGILFGVICGVKDSTIIKTIVIGLTVLVLCMFLCLGMSPPNSKKELKWGLGSSGGAAWIESAESEKRALCEKYATELRELAADDYYQEITKYYEKGNLQQSVDWVAKTRHPER